MSYAIAIDKDSSTPIYQQIYERMSKDIVAGTLPPGTKLPSIRALASDLGIARNTVDAAYRQLQVEGFVESRQGSGFSVLELPRAALLGEHSGTRYSAPPERQRERFAYDFRYGSLGAGTFPAESWRKLAGEVLGSADAAELSAYGNEHGEMGLRAQIARHLHRERNVVCAPEQVIVTSGTQQALELLCRLLDPHTDTIGMENPGFAPARLVFASLGFRLVPLSTEYGSEQFLEDAARSGARLLYTTPSHQFPMGDCMDVGTRAALISLADELDAYIIEDNYDSEFRYNAQPVPSLQSIDHLGRVVYMGSFSKALSPALRMGYLVLPPQLVSSYKERLRGMRCTVPWVEQETMRLFMERGLWEKHLHRMQLVRRKQHDLLVETVGSTFDGRVRLLAGDAGMFVLLNVDNGMNQEELVRSAAEHGIGVTGTRQYWADGHEAPEALVLIGYSAADERSIRDGIPALARAWFG